jgi:prepilin-type N-terminal cleavage/methylation domain-containing protein
MTPQRASKTNALPKRLAGFNLIEMAIVLVILGVLLGGLITPFSSQLEASQRRGADNLVNDIHDALLGYAATNGRLPCPATAATSGLSAPNTATTACTSNHGFVPARTLGLNGSVDGNSLLLDPWLNPIRYSVTGAGTGAYTNDITLTLTPDFRICQQSACTGTLADNVVAVVFSLGEDGTATTSPDQLENTDGDTTFVNRTFSELGGAEFDDHVQWLSPATLTYQLVRAGQLD